MIVVNLFGGPGCGKSTTAAWLFSELKKRKISCEYITEFAKDLTWEENKVALNCQEYVFGNQSYRMARIQNKVDVLITDSPLPLSIIYNKTLKEPEFSTLVWETFNKYNNVNFLLSRGDIYDNIGRNETHEEAVQIDGQIFNLLLLGDIGSVRCFDITNEETTETILSIVLDELQNM